MSTAEKMMELANQYAEAAKVPDFLRAPVDPATDDGSPTRRMTLQEAGLEARETILQEAQRLTHGPRQADYSHPLDDYTRTAALVNAAFAHKLKEPFMPEEVTLIMALVKISRQVHKPKRDNMVDLAGYAWCTDDIPAERNRRVAEINKARARGIE